MTVPSYRFSEVSHHIDQLSEELVRSGDPEAGHRLLRAAALVELESEELQACWGGPMNGQESRQALVLELLQRIPFSAIVETGTYRGLTTSWLASHFDGPILSCEASYKYFLQAKDRLQAFTNVEVTLADSRRFLRELFASKDIGETIFFYLDAHWEDDLPLREELDIIFSQNNRAVVMIDDFQVPDDAGYSYDDYGPGKALSLDIVDGLKGVHRSFFFPRLESHHETGAKRGVCIVSNGLDDMLSSIPALRGADWDTWNAKRLELAEEKNMVEVHAAREAIAELVHAQTLELRDAAAAQHDQVVRSLSHIGELSAATQDEVARSLRIWGSKLDEFLDSADEKKGLGREVVELRAMNLDLKRQLHRKEIMCQQLQHSLELAESALVAVREEPSPDPADVMLVEEPSPEPADIIMVEEPQAKPMVASEDVTKDPVQEGPSLLPDLMEAQAMLVFLSRSRALKAVSALSSRPSVMLGDVQAKIAAIIQMEEARRRR